MFGKIKDWLNDVALSFQPAYDRIKAWKLSPEVDALLDKVWSVIPVALQEAVFRFVKEVYDKYGKELAEDLLKRLIEAIKNAIDRGEAHD